MQLSRTMQQYSIRLHHNDLIHLLGKLKKLKTNMKVPTGKYVD